MKSFITAVKVVFIAIMIILTVYFISDAWHDWETYPTVTSVDFRNIEKELFPAVTVCYPNTWKWPGIINLLNKWNTSATQFDIGDEANYGAWNLTVGSVFQNNEQTIEYTTQFFKIADRRATALQFDFIVNGNSFDFCFLVKKLFETPEEKIQGRFFLNVIDQIAKGNMPDDQMEEILNAFDLSRRVGKSLKFEDAKKDVCELAIIDCNQDLDIADICANSDGFSKDKFLSYYYSIYRFWVINQFWNPTILLQSIQHKAFESKTDYSSSKNYHELFKLVKALSKGYAIDAYSLSHILKGVYVARDDEVVKAVNSLFQRKQIENDLSSYGFCLDDERCQSVKESLKTLDDKDIKKYLQFMDQPKVHKGGTEGNDLILVPMCSFGLEPLLECKQFQKSKVTFQDDTCFTYENPAKVGYKNASFQFVVNLRENMPKDDPLSLKVLLHEQGTIPDVLEIDSASQTIYAENDFTKIGVTIDSNEITDSFADMRFEKRNCYLENELKNYSRMGCLTKHIFQAAIEASQCVPWTMPHLWNQAKPFCNLDGAIIFRNSSKDMNGVGEDTCPKMCSSKQYKMQTPDHVRFDPWQYGETYLEFLSNDPTNQLLEELYVPVPDDLGRLRNVEWYIRKNSKAFSMVQVYFQDPQMTVITKDAKVTFPDMIGNIGGTIGIFLGLSCLSLLDLAIDVADFIKKKLH